jgi:hypothetical protein
MCFFYQGKKKDKPPLEHRKCLGNKIDAKLALLLANLP